MIFLVDRFCPKCGATDKPFIDGFCIDCYLEDHNLVNIPKKIHVDACPSCLRLRLKGNWVTPTPQVLEKFITSKAKIKTIKNPEIYVRQIRTLKKGIVLEVKVKGVLGDIPIEITREVELVYHLKLCDICSKKKSRYYKVLIQLRPKNKSTDPSKIQSAFHFIRNKNREHALKDREAEIFRFKKEKHGINVYLGSAKAAFDIVNSMRSAFGAKVKESRTLVGVDKDGKKKFRITYSVRI